MLSAIAVLASIKSTSFRFSALLVMPVFDRYSCLSFPYISAPCTDRDTMVNMASGISTYSLPFVPICIGVSLTRIFIPNSPYFPRIIKSILQSLFIPSGGPESTILSPRYFDIIISPTDYLECKLLSAYVPYIWYFFLEMHPCKNVITLRIRI